VQKKILQVSFSLDHSYPLLQIHLVKTHSRFLSEMQVDESKHDTFIVAVSLIKANKIGTFKSQIEILLLEAK
jgi:hypothetical protein